MKRKRVVSTSLLMAMLFIMNSLACEKNKIDIPPLTSAFETSTENYPTDSGDSEPKTQMTFDEPTIVVGTAEAHPGDIVILPIYVRQSPGIAACRFVVEYDIENLSLESVAYGPHFAENGEESAGLNSPLILAWSQLENMEGDDLFAELTFRVNEEAKVFRNLPVTLTCYPGDLINIDEVEVAFAIQNGFVSTVA